MDEGSTGDVRLHPPQDDSVGAALDDAHVHVGVGLLAGIEAAISLDVAHGDGDEQVLLEETPVVPVEILGVHRIGVAQLRLHPLQGEDRVGERRCRTHPGGVGDLLSLAAGEDLLGVAGHDHEAVDQLAGSLGVLDREVRSQVVTVKARVVVGVVERLGSGQRVLDDVGDLLAAGVQHTAVLDRLEVLVGRLEGHRVTPSRCDGSRRGARRGRDSRRGSTAAAGSSRRPERRPRGR